jgi:beta-phosphoglucomutase-like phosphatase (HAD superfamily)
MIRAVIFDFNGILADDDPIHMHAFRRVAEEEGLTFTEDEYMERYLPLNDRDCFSELWRKNARALKNGELDDLIRRKSVYYFGAIEKKDVLFKGAPEAVHAAAGRGPVGIASGASAGEIRHILDTAGLLDCFSTIVAAEDVRRGKPDPQPFQLAFDRLKEYCVDLEPQECAAVEDSLGGIQSAHSAGMPCLGVAHSYSRERLEGAKPKWVIDSIADFADWLNKV